MLLYIRVLNLKSFVCYSMKTKKLLLGALFLCLCAVINAQGFAGFGAGYGTSISGTVLGYNSSDNSVNNTYFTENVKGSYGRGMNLNVYGGFMVNDIIGLELAANYLIGSKYTFTNSDIDNNSSSTTVYDVHATSFRLIPCIRLSYGENKFRYYSRVALAFGLSNKLTEVSNRTITNPGGTDMIYNSFEYSGGLYMGFTGAFGLTYQLSDNIALYGELTRYFISWGAKEGRFTEYTVNGVDELGNLTTDQKEYLYVDKIDQSMNQNPGEPRKALKFYTPLNALSLSLGLHFTF